MHSERRAVSEVMVEFFEDLSVFQIIVENFPGCCVAFFGGCTVEQRCVCPRVILPCCQFVGREDFEFGRASCFPEKGVLFPEFGPRGRLLLFFGNAGVDSGEGAEFGDKHRPVFRRVVRDHPDEMAVGAYRGKEPEPCVDPGSGS